MDQRRLHNAVQITHLFFHRRELLQNYLSPLPQKRARPLLVNSTVSEVFPEIVHTNVIGNSLTSTVRLCNACGLHYSKILKKERTNASKGVGAIKVNNLLNPSSSDENSDADPKPVPFNSPNVQRMAFQPQQTPTVYNFHSYTPQPNSNAYVNNNHQIPSNPLPSNFRMQRISQPARPKATDVNTEITRQNSPNNTQAHQHAQNASIVIHPPLQSWKQ
jgi:hypothetical protein